MSDFQERQDLYLTDIINEITQNSVKSHKKLVKKYKFEGNEAEFVFANLMSSLACTFLGKYLSQIRKDKRLDLCKKIVTDAVKSVQKYDEMKGEKP